MLKLNSIYEGNCMDVIKTFPDKSIDCVITSPPYWQLRDYGWSGQWGLEPTFQEYLQHLWQLMTEIRRILKDEGTCWINIGDTYSGNKTGNDDPKLNDNIKKSEVNKKVQSVRDKSLCLIPHRFAIGCIDAGWICRNDIVWAKRNGMPESVTDRFSKKHEYFFFMVKSEKYYFDLDGIRDNHKTASIERYKYNFIGNPDGLDRKQSGAPQGNKNILGNMDKNGQTRTTAGLSMKTAAEKMNEFGKNPGSISDFWDIPTKGNSDKHFASYNTKLIDKPIISGTPEGGIILDPFCGTATTGVRALQLNRKFIGIEGSDAYVKIGNRKLKIELQKLKLF